MTKYAPKKRESANYTLNNAQMLHKSLNLAVRNANN